MLQRCGRLRELRNARGKMYRRNKSRAEAEDALYFNPEMYILVPSRVVRLEELYVSYNK